MRCQLIRLNLFVSFYPGNLTNHIPDTELGHVILNHRSERNKARTTAMTEASLDGINLSRPSSSIKI